ncbi:hypothetical protein P4639_22500 [Priestia megaterium]|uniref:hypothetical protein n=1 Tax=Priestia megaterium TaxID=1404 RepID=UPI002E251E94|nr:hypothetical protein [Priestia megaterium]
MVGQLFVLAIAVFIIMCLLLHVVDDVIKWIKRDGLMMGHVLILIFFFPVTILHFTITLIKVIWRKLFTIPVGRK